MSAGKQKSFDGSFEDALVQVRTLFHEAAELARKRKELQSKRVDRKLSAEVERRSRDLKSHQEYVESIIQTRKPWFSERGLNPDILLGALPSAICSEEGSLASTRELAELYSDLLGTADY